MQIFENKTLLITGGTGSFGNAVLNRFLDSNIAQIRIFSRDEKKQDDMRLQLSNDRLKFHIGDVRNIDSVRDVMRGVDYVFHAAALKQVPSCEFYPMEAVQTNVLGAENVIRAAIDEGVQKCVVLSTDKAVYPINAMGISKAMMEKVMVAKSRLTNSDKTILCATRYGNVMGSRGSVIPFFLEKAKTGVLPITDPEMTRFNISLDEGVEMVFWALEHGLGGEILVPKIASYRIVDVANAIAPNCRQEIVGIRPGEKLHEEMITHSDSPNTIDLGGYYAILSPSSKARYLASNLNAVLVSPGFAYESGTNPDFLSVEQIRALIRNHLNPQFNPI